MSYIRQGWALEFVDGISRDYIFASSGVKGYKKGKEFIEDYGKITNDTIVEILATRFLSEDKLFRDYLLPILAERLNVKLRKKPLTQIQQIKLMEKNIKKVNQLFKEIGGEK